MVENYLLPAIGAGALSALQHGLVIAFVCAAFLIMRGVRHEEPKWKLSIKALAASTALAMLAAFTLGNPTCADSDPLFGGCYQHNDDGYKVDDKDRVKTFTHVLLLLSIASLAGIHKRD